MHPLKRSILCALGLVLCSSSAPWAQSSSRLPAPAVILDPSETGMAVEAPSTRHPLPLSRLFSLAEFRNDPESAELLLDLHDSELFGHIHVGPFYHGLDESRFVEPRYRRRAQVVGGKAKVRLGADVLHGAAVRSTEDGVQGVIAYRLDLWRKESGEPRRLGLRDGRLHIMERHGDVEPMLSIVEGPMVGLVQSDHPEWCVLAIETDENSLAIAEVKGLGRFESATAARRHELRIEGLEADRSYRYRILAHAGADTAVTPWLSLKSAPRAGEGEVLMAFGGDSRGSYGGEEYRYVGVNLRVLSMVARNAVAHDVDLLLFGGDLITGHVDSVDDFASEFKAFKQSLFGLGTSRPLYTALGNHEALEYRWKGESGPRIRMDMWPYQERSAEAVFARELVQPRNGPSAQPGLPPYEENVFSFRYGPVGVIVCNNNYWYTSLSHVSSYGGSPEGYILPEQLEWLETRLEEYGADDTVRYVLIVMQEPVYPNGGHLDDAMWHLGDNGVRAYKAEGDELVAWPYGMVELRNRMWELISGNRKVAAVLCSDEHNYHRTLIDSETPVGVMSQDDLDGNGRLDDESFSANPGFEYPTWSLVSGGVGAPYYIRDDAPWAESVSHFSTINHYLLLRADEKGISMECRALDGTVIDRVDDLMAVKR